MEDVCNDCGDKLRLSDMVSDCQGNAYCLDCMSERFMCIECDTIKHVMDMVPPGLCQGCYDKEEESLCF